MSNYAQRVGLLPRTLTYLEQAKLLKTTGEHRRGFRDHMLFSLALGTGMRQHELLALNIGDVFEGRHAKRRLVLRVFKGSGRAPAPQEVVLPQRVRRKLDRFYGWKHRQKQDIAPEAPLFVSRLGRRLSARQVRELFETWQTRSGFERRLNFHALRHTACSNLYRRTKDLRLTQRFGRHASVVTTTLYTHPSDEELVQAVLELPC